MLKNQKEWKKGRRESRAALVVRNDTEKGAGTEPGV